MEENTNEVRPKDETMPHERTPMSLKMDCLYKQGYVDEFQICEEGLKSLETQEVFQPKDVRVVERQRFEGITNPDDMAILYVIETSNGLKGTLVDAYGIYGDADLSHFMKKVENQTVDNMDRSCEL
jgi:hypothetical protein